MFENQMKKKRVAMNANHFFATSCRPCSRRVMLLRRQVVGPLDRRLDLVRAVGHAAGDADHRPGGQRGREEDVHHRLVDAHVDRPELELDPGVELELVLGLELLVLAVRAEDREQDQRTGRTTPSAR